MDHGEVLNPTELRASRTVVRCQTDWQSQAAVRRRLNPTSRGGILFAWWHIKGGAGAGVLAPVLSLHRLLPSNAERNRDRID